MSQIQIQPTKQQLRDLIEIAGSEWFMVLALGNLRTTVDAGTDLIPGDTWELHQARFTAILKTADILFRLPAGIREQCEEAGRASYEELRRIAEARTSSGPEGRKRRR